MAKKMTEADSIFFRLIQLLRIGVFFALLVSIFLALPGQIVFAQGTGTITGTVRGPGGSLLAGVSVYASGPSWGQATSAADGTYTITGLTAGSYRLGAVGSGWGTQYYNNTANVNEATTVTVMSGFTTPGIDFNLVVGGSITGTVRGPGGTPVANIAVSTEGASSLLDVYSDENGTYTITGLQPGNHVVYARGNGLLVMQYYNNATSSNDATPVSVVSGGTTSGIDFNLVVGGTITGIVLANGSPLANASVSTQYGYATTDEYGIYTITGHPVGSYTVSASGNGWVRQYYNLVHSYQSATAVAVTSGGTTPNINFNLVAGGTISGTVKGPVGQPLPNIFVSASDTGGLGLGMSAASDADGTYTITGLLAGSYRVEASGSEWVRQYYDHSNTYNTATPVAVTSGGTTSGINFDLVAGGTISGTVRGSDGNLLPGANVCTSSLLESNPCTQSDANGAYALTGLAPGSYFVNVQGIGGGASQYYNHADSMTTASAVTVTSGASTTGINFNLVEGGIISGTVRGPGGTPVAGVMVLAQNTPGIMFFVAGASAQTAADGTYTIAGLPAGIYFVQAYPIMNLGYVPQYYNNAVSSSTATALAVTSGGTTSGIDFNLIGGGVGGTISGTVTGSGGTTPFVYARNMATGASFPATPSGGTYSITGLPAGSYHVYAQSSFFVSSLTQFYNNAYSFSTATPVTVTSGGTTSGIDFNMVTPSDVGTIQGIITLPGGLPCPSCQVMVYDAVSSSVANFPFYGTITLSDGSYQIGSLPVGSYKIGVANRSLGPMLYSGNSSYYWPATTSINSAFLVPVTAGETTPDINIQIEHPFTFTDQTGVARSTLATSNTIVVWWIDPNATASISIEGGVYSVNGGAYTSSSGTVSYGNSVQVRQTSSSSYGATTNATLTIGAISDTFSVTTLANTSPVITTPPTSGIEGTGITINGSNFGAVQGGSYVDFSGFQGTVGYWSDTQIVVTVPSGAISGTMRVVTPQGTSSTNFTVYPPVCGAPIKVAGSNYFTIQDAYNNASTGSTVQITEGLFNTGSLEFNRNISTRVVGGYDCGYSIKTGYSTVDGTVTIKAGSVTVEGLIIK